MMVTMAQLTRLTKLLLATLIVCAFGFSQMGWAHEVRPAVADIGIKDDRVEISLRLSLEAFIARIDLSAYTDTNDAPNAAAHDALRALGPTALEQRVRSAWPELRKTISLKTPSGPLDLEISGVSIPQTGDVELARDSSLMLRADLAPDGGGVTFGWQKENGPLIVRQTGAGEAAYTGYLKDGAQTPALSASAGQAQSGWQVFGRYIVVGFEHIIPKGLDHILFVLGLFFFSYKWRPLLIQISAFTVAHTITLALAVLGLVRVPASIVEPLIALSIVYVAVENLFAPRLRLWRPALVFAFGLLHGLGFASVLLEVGLSTAHLAAGLLGFNVGVELGQLAVVGLALVLLAVPFGSRPWYRAAIAIPGSLAIAATGLYWFVERTFF